MSKEKKELSELLESYQNSAEQFYQQAKRYYQTGITTSVNIPFTPEDISFNPLEVVKYILRYKLFSYHYPKNMHEFCTILFESGPFLFKGDQIEILITDKKVLATVGNSQINFNNELEDNNYTIRIKLVKDGPVRKRFETEGVNRDQMADHLKNKLKTSIYSALKSILFDGFSDNPQADLDMSNAIVNPMGVVIKEPKDVEQVLNAPYSTDLGLRDLEELYQFNELLNDENWWIFGDVDLLRDELKIIINKSRQLRIDSPICDE